MANTTTESTHLSDTGLADKAFGPYLLGFVFCLILTVIPFYAVMYRIGSKQQILSILLFSALAQFFVQVKYFLRMHTQTLMGKVNVMIFMFVGIITFIVVGGSIWIMDNLNYFMVH